MKQTHTLTLLISALLCSSLATETSHAQAPAPPPGPPTAAAPAAPAMPGAPSMQPAAPAMQAPPTAPPPAAVDGRRDESIYVALPADGGDGLDQGDDDLITITLDNVPLVDVVRMFTRISGANIIANASDLTGTVTVNLEDVAWKPALNSILDMHSLALVEKQLDSGVYSIVPRPLDAPTPMMTKSFQLKFATVSDIAPIVQNMLPDGASLNQFNSRNMLVIRSTAESLSDIDQIIVDIDQPTKQVCVETKFMELNDRASKQLGIRWDALEAYGVNLQPGPFTWGRDTQDSYGREDRQTQYDRRTQSDTRQELYDVNGVQYEETTIQWTDHDDDPLTPPLAQIDRAPTRRVDDSIARGKENTQDIVETFTRTIETTQNAILEMDQFRLVLSALQSTEGVSLVSNPKMIVANGATNAVFSVGDREPIIRTEIQRGTIDSPGDIITAELDTDVNTEYISDGYLATGIDLRVIPVVKTDDLIEAEIIPSLRRKTDDKFVAGNSWPIISVKEIRTRFTLRSGQTVAIGGLTDTSNLKDTTQIPFLGSIPLIGKYLFSHTEDVKKQVETIIFVTLSLAQPETLYDTVGIPLNADLVHRRMIKDRVTFQEREDRLQQLKEAADAAQMEREREARARMLRRRE